MSFIQRINCFPGFAAVWCDSDCEQANHDGYLVLT